MVSLEGTVIISFVNSECCVGYREQAFRGVEGERGNGLESTNDLLNSIIRIGS
jgi:hypothetical protein